MFRRCIPVVALAAASWLAAAPAFAASHVIFQKSNKYATGIPVMVGLLTGHSYRVDISAPTKRSFVASGYENYSYIANKGMFQRTASVSKHGSTPATFVVKQPRAGKLTQWVLGLQVQITKGRGVTVRVTDLGTGK